ncbi:hypothetical protein BJ165DRAFT_1344669 [Panaeolus papilionaceus]|nr:hypothetical protein BJ165DRAFT_1344669 [Panaeolus papilionaceus]
MISYNIACQWYTNLARRLKAEEWPKHLDTPDPAKTTLTPAILKLHEPMHEAKNHQQYSLNYIPGVGLSDFEVPERVWAGHNALGNSTKTHGPGSRHLILDDNFNFWNWLKYVGLGDTYRRKYKAAVVHRNIQVEAHKGLTEALDKTMVKSWELLCELWEKDSNHPKTAENPFEYEDLELSEAETRRDLLKEEEKRLAEGGQVLHETSPASFIIMGLDIEDTQRRLRRLAKDTPTNAVARQEGGLIEQCNQLRARIRGWELLLPIYVPGLASYRAEHHLLENAKHPENHLLWLPSKVPAESRPRIFHSTLPDIEETLCTRQCFDALHNI